MTVVAVAVVVVVVVVALTVVIVVREQNTIDASLAILLTIIENNKL